jgi:hypothetical protein
MHGPSTYVSLNLENSLPRAVSRQLDRISNVVLCWLALIWLVPKTVDDIQLAGSFLSCGSSRWTGTHNRLLAATRTHMCASGNGAS